MTRNRHLKIPFLTGAVLLTLAACALPDAAAVEYIQTPPNDSPTASSLPPKTTPTPALQPLSTPKSFGPNSKDFPAGYNPLSGQPVKDPQLLQIPAMLLSISHFPPAARPQAGLSFAPWVFEFYIAEGATRFLGVFHGEFPEPEIPIVGGCETRRELFIQNSAILGNRVWLDENKNGRQETYEPGVGGICVNLYDGAEQLIESTTTDSNGYYGFNVEAGAYSVEFILPEWLNFTKQNVGNENADSDADPVTGRSQTQIESSNLYLDAGLIPSTSGIPTPSGTAQAPKAEVGPIRSGRLVYADIAGFFQSSCLVYAFASREVLENIPKCSMVAHEDAGGGSMLPIERMRAVAEDNMRHTRGGFDYSSNLFSEEPPEGGTPAKQIKVFVARLNQSGWTYDPLYGAWLRFVDNADPATAGQLHADTDRLNGRQLYFKNFIVVFAETSVVSPTNLDIHLEQGSGGYAFLFRDRMKYDIRWSARADDYERKTGQRRPMKFINPDGGPAALKPGNTWIFIATPYSTLSEEGGGVWRLRFYAPAGVE